MKKLALFAALLFLPLFASAQSPEALLTPDGTLYSIETQAATDTTDPTGGASLPLVLTTRHDGEVSHQLVPATTNGGQHENPALAYDAESQTLFVFWVHHHDLFSSELLFASLDAQGNWSETTAFGHPFDYRENLRIAVTKRVTDDEGNLSAGISVHLTWWEFESSTGKENARYAMIAIEGGKAVSTDFINLDVFRVAQTDQVANDNVDVSILKQPLIFPSAKQDSVLLVYGDMQTHTFHEVRVTPHKVETNGRLRVPGGRSEGGFPAPTLGMQANSTMGGIYDDNDHLAFYVGDGHAVRYAILKDGAWSDPRALALDDELTSSAAVDAIRRLVSDH
ncbi:MAG: hypothetical protein JO197_04175 [Acidobacteria bacterium]|nr:hypothetical protein [Acidobacteriota bacterium]MBV9476417.1 hypothetical protein [Acidobacteriota bacterium]